MRNPIFNSRSNFVFSNNDQIENKYGSTANLMGKDINHHERIGLHF